MEGEYLCEIRYACASSFKLIITKDTSDSTKFIFMDSCQNAFSGSLSCFMTQNSDEFRSGTFCNMIGKFFPLTDSLYAYRAEPGCGSGCTCGLVYKCKKVIPVSLAENKLEKLQLLPNPVRENLQVKYLNGLLNYSIYNSLGALAKSGQLTESNAQIEVIALPKGIYFIQFEQEGLQYTEKFVKE